MSKSPSSTQLKVLELLLQDLEATNEALTKKFNAERATLGKAPVGQSSLGGPIAWARMEAGIHVTSRGGNGRSVSYRSVEVLAAAARYGLPFGKRAPVEETPAPPPVAPPAASLKVAPLWPLPVTVPPVPEAVPVPDGLEAAIGHLAREMARLGISRLTVTAVTGKKKK